VSWWLAGLAWGWRSRRGGGGGGLRVTASTVVIERVMLRRNWNVAVPFGRSHRAV